MRDAAERKPGLAADVSSRPLRVAEAPSELREIVKGWRAAGETVALVPTMGALHAGHLALLTEAQRSATRTIVSIFVNPTQFAPAEDLDRYPRTFEQDCALLSRAGADLVYAPSVEAMYPRGFSTAVAIGGPARVGLEDAARPHFFGGVATVVAKLLLQCLPDIATFGEKDYQQLCVVSTMVRELDIPVEILPVPTVREADGLAMSSRNRFLSADERRRAAAVPEALNAAAAAIRAGMPLAETMATARATLMGAGCLIDYVEARRSDTLEVLDGSSGPIRLLAAVRLGSVRLIDNMAV